MTKTNRLSTEELAAGLAPGEVRQARAERDAEQDDAADPDRGLAGLDLVRVPDAVPQVEAEHEQQAADGGEPNEKVNGHGRSPACLEALRSPEVFST